MLYLLIFLCICLILYHTKKALKPNKYVNRHNAFEKDDRHYREYVKYCEKNNKIPLSRREFKNPISDKKKKLEDLLDL